MNVKYMQLNLTLPFFASMFLPLSSLCVLLACCNKPPRTHARCRREIAAAAYPRVTGRDVPRYVPSGFSALREANLFFYFLGGGVCYRPWASSSSLLSAGTDVTGPSASLFTPKPLKLLPPKLPSPTQWAGR